jgi:flagellar M-ring protein FliF
MNRLSEYIKKIYEKLKALSIRRKIAYGTIIAGVILAVVVYSVYSSQNKYGLLFKISDAKAGQAVTAQLIADKETYKVEADAIYVLKTRMDELRLKYALDMSSDSVGFEIFDNQAQFSSDTEEQFNIKKQRATQGELERTIKSIPQVENVRVHVAMPDSSPFGVDDEKGKVSVYLTLKAGATLDASKAKAIIILISGSLENVPRENVVITDDSLKSYTYNSSELGQVGAGVEPDTQQAMELKFESKLESAVRSLLGPALGPGNINVKINVDMNFDSKERTTVTYDPNKVLLSSKNIVEGKLGNIDGVTTSPVDNNMVNYYVTTAGAIEKGVTKIDSTANWDVGSTTDKILYAPGEVTRVTASVMYDGTLSALQTSQIKDAVSGAIGARADRNDTVSIVAMAFDPVGKQTAQKAIDEMKAQAISDAKLKTYGMIAAAAAGAVLLIVFGIIMLLKKKKKKKRKPMPGSLDVVIGDDIYDKVAVPYVPLDLDVESETSGIEKDIKKYAEEKPDQVVDIIKSWLAEDER